MTMDNIKVFRKDKQTEMGNGSFSFNPRQFIPYACTLHCNRASYRLFRVHHCDGG